MVTILYDLDVYWTNSEIRAMTNPEFPPLSFIAIIWPEPCTWKTENENQLPYDVIIYDICRVGVLGLVKPKLCHRTDGNPASEILTLTFEVIFSKKPYIHRSLVHSSARDQLRNFDQFEVIFLRNTMCGCRTASLVLKFSGFSGNF